MTAGGVSTPFTLYLSSGVDRADGVSRALLWPLALEDGSVYQHSYASPTAFTNGYHVDFTFPMNSQGYVPSNASISDVRIYHRWRSSSTAQLCYNVQLYAADGTLVASGGTSSAPYRCRTHTTMETDVITVDADRVTAANANGLVIRLSFRAAVAGIGPFHDYLALGVTYSA